MMIQMGDNSVVLEDEGVGEAEEEARRWIRGDDRADVGWVSGVGESNR